MDTKEKRLQWIVDNVLMGAKNLADILGMKPSGVYKYLNGKQKIADKLGVKLTNAGISYEWYLTGLGNIYADNEQGQILKQQNGDVMSRINKSGVRFIATIDPEEDIRIPLMLTSVKAGALSWAGSDVQSYVSVKKYHHAGSFYMMVEGDSMVGAGVEEGMRVLVDTTLEAKTNQIVLARYAGTENYTVKRLKKNGKDMLLHPDNPDYEPIPVDENIVIMGVVTKAERVFV